MRPAAPPTLVVARPRVPRRPASSASCSTPPAGRTRAARAAAVGARWPPRSPARCRSSSPAAWTRPTSAGRCSPSRRSASTSPPASSGRACAGERPRKDPFRVALFVKRARAARVDRPNLPFGPTPVHAGLLEADARGRWGTEREFGGRYVPETLMAALEQLEAAYDALRQDPRLLGRAARAARPRSSAARRALYRADRLARGRAEAERLGPRRRRAAHRHPAAPPLPQARGPRPHRRPQDQQRARPGAADPAARQVPGHRRDRRRPARRRDGHRLRAARPAVRRLHGRRGHPPPGARTCCACARSAPRSRAVTLGHRHAQGRRQRGDARLGHERRRRPTTCSGSAMGPHPYPTIVRDLQRRHRRRGRGPAAGRRGPAARRRARLRRRRLERDRAARAVHRRAGGAPGGRRGGRRRHRDRAPCGGARRRDARASSTARARSCSRTPTARWWRRTRSRPASTTRASGRSSRRCPRPGGWRSRRRPTARRSPACDRRPARRASCPRSRPAHAIAALPRAAGRRRTGSAARGRTTRSCCSGSPAAATRTSRPRAVRGRRAVGGAR